MRQEEQAENIKDPLVLSLTEFIKSIKMDIMLAGASKLNHFSKLYKDLFKVDAKSQNAKNY
jgi:enamine deaminase RidA (YjgF/YER057c/UK114 family)